MARFEIKLPKDETQPYVPLPSGPMVTAALDKIPGTVECPVCHGVTNVEKLSEVPTRCPWCGHGAA